jgi:hypothetical protein
MFTLNTNETLPSPSPPRQHSTLLLSPFSPGHEYQTFCVAGKAGEGGGGTQDADPALRVHPQVVKATQEHSQSEKSMQCPLF